MRFYCLVPLHDINITIEKPSKKFWCSFLSLRPHYGVDSLFAASSGSASRPRASPVCKTVSITPTGTLLQKQREDLRCNKATAAAHVCLQQQLTERTHQRALPEEKLSAAVTAAAATCVRLNLSFRLENSTRKRQPSCCCCCCCCGGKTASVS